MSARTSLVLTGSIIATAMLSAAAWAQPLCASRGEILGKLGSEYKETPTALGLASNGVLIEVLASPAGSFTIVATQPSGRSCAIAAGKNWSEKLLPAAGGAADSPS